MTRQRASFDLSKALFILPNAFTVASIFCGIYAILNAVEQNGPQAFYQSSIAVFFAGFFDMCDGRIARLTKTQSDFGMQFDSLADVISFGVAPAVIVYKWALWPLGSLGFFAAFVFTSCGAIRLARHNVLAAEESDPPEYFVGLPIPLAAAMLVALIIAHFKIFAGLPVQRHHLILFLVLFLGLLMVSRVPYWTFKKIRLGIKSLLILVAIVAIVVAISQVYPASVSLVFFIGAYIFAGIFRLAFLLATRKNSIS